MEAIYSEYDFKSGIERIDEILGASDNNYEDKESIPIRTSLSFTNGYHVTASAIFIDIRSSKELPAKHSKQKLAKLYRTYISETVAVLKGNEKINELYIEGDGIWGIFDTKLKIDIDSVFSTAAQVSSLIDILNFKFSKNGITSITIGIGLAYSSSLYIKAGYKNSGINEVVWIGNLVGEAAELCTYGNRTNNDKEIMASNVFYNNLNDNNKKLFEWNPSRSCYHGNVINTSMNSWLEEQKKQEQGRALYGIANRWL